MSPAQVERRNRAVELYGQGLSTARVAEELGVSLGTAWADLKAMDVAFRHSNTPLRKRLMAEGKTQPNEWFKEEVRKYKETNELLSADEVAGIVGCKPELVRAYARKGRLKSRRYPGRWGGPSKPFLFKREAAEILPQLIEQTKANLAAAAAARMVERGKAGTSPQDSDRN